jgi:hypothetical protein
MTIGPACLISFPGWIRPLGNGNYELKIPNGIIMQTAAGNVTLYSYFRTQGVRPKARHGNDAKKY